MTSHIVPAQLLSEATWLRRLAARLADDRDDADDLVQDAWIAAWRSEPDPARPLRPWLAGTPEALLAQAQLHRVLVDLVLRLDEPYRATVLARFVEGRTAADIARTTGVPEGTVRWRLSEALRRLRDQLDQRVHRRAWLPGMTLGSPAMWTSNAKIVAVAVGAILAVLALWSTGWLGGDGRRAPGPPGPARSSPGPGPSHAGSARDVEPTWLVAADPSAAAITGRVVNEDGNAIAGATVQLQRFGAASAVTDEATVIAGADGAFRLHPRWATPYIVVASAPDRAAASAPVDPRTRGATSTELVLMLSSCTQSAAGNVTDTGGGPIVCLTRGANWLEIGADGYEHVLREVVASGHHRVDVALAPGAAVRGTVVDAATGAPIAGVSVAMWPVARRSGEGSDRSAVSAADGTFTIDGLAANRYILTARDRDHVRTVVEEVEVNAATPSELVTLRMQTGVTVRGSVRTRGEPVPGARVTLELPGANWGGTSAAPLDVVTDRVGHFEFYGAPRAALVPRVIGFHVQSPALIDTRDLTDEVAVVVEPLPTVRGHVVRHGAPAGDAEVTAKGPSGTRLNVRSDAVGAFELPGVQPGPYDLFASSARAGAFTTKATRIRVETDVEVTIELDAGARIDGVVVDSIGEPVPGVQVSATKARDQDHGTCVSDAEGRFLIDALAGGPYSLEVAPYPGAGRALPWARTPPADVVLAGGDSRAGPITLVVVRVERPISGVVLDDQGAPVADAIIRLGPVSGARTEVPTTRSDVGGRFTLRALGDGPFSLDAGIGGGPLATATGIAAGTTDVVLRLVRPGAVDGTLLGLADARIGLVPGDYSILAATETKSASAVFRVAAGETAAVTLAASLTRTISGTVTVFGTGTPVAGMTCIAVPAVGDVRPPGVTNDLTSRGTSDRSGGFTIAGAPASEALVLCPQVKGYSTGSARIGPADVATVEVVAVPPQVPGAFGFSLDETRINATVGGVEDSTRLPGLAAGDRIVAVEEANVSALDSQAVYWLIAGRAIGSTLAVTFARDKESFTHEVQVMSPAGQ